LLGFTGEEVKKSPHKLNVPGLILALKVHKHFIKVRIKLSWFSRKKKILFVFENPLTTGISLHCKYGFKESDEARKNSL
jgi:hypothetical protein